jgi:hypothetical protein
MASLIRSNKYLATGALRQKAVRVTVATSSAIEGIHAPFKPAKVATEKLAATKLKRSHAKSA